MPSPTLPAANSSDWAELVVLSVLADSPAYGYSISKKVEARSDGGMRLTPGVLYPLLKGLERDGLILSEWEEIRSDRAAPSTTAPAADSAPDEAPGRKRKWYRLSAKGRKRLEQRVRSHRAFQAMIDAFIGGGSGGTKKSAGEEARP